MVITRQFKAQSSKGLLKLPIISRSVWRISNFQLFTKCVLSLRRSIIRRRILEFLASTGSQGAYLSEIARATGARADQVLMALKGYGDKYRKDLSLLNLKLVQFHIDNGVKLYRITDLGIEILAALKSSI